MAATRKIPPRDDEVRTRIFTLLNEQRFSSKEASRRIGKGDTYLHQYLHQQTPKRLPEEVRHKLAELLNVDEGLLRPGGGGPSRSAPTFSLAAETIPVMGRAEAAGSDVVMMQDGRVEGLEPRPPTVLGVSDAYAVDVSGVSMEPRLFAGHRLIVHPGRPARRGDLVVVQMHGDHPGEVVGWIKEYRRTDSDGVHLHQYNPDRDILATPEQVIAVHTVVEVIMR